MQVGLLGGAVSSLGNVGLGVLGAIGTLDAFAQSIQRIEGYLPPGTPGYPDGSLAYRNNNPGNLIYTPYYAQHFGAVPGLNGFSRFPDYATGYAALQHQILIDAGHGYTILTMIQKYAPSSDGNNPTQYANSIANELGVPVNTPVSQVVMDEGQTVGPELLDGGVQYAGVGGGIGIGVMMAGLAGILLLDLLRK